MKTVSDYFGSMVFDDRVMRSVLSADVYILVNENNCCFID